MLAHEFEHILEQIEGLNLRSLSRSEDRAYGRSKTTYSRAVARRHAGEDRSAGEAGRYGSFDGGRLGTCKFQVTSEREKC